MAARYLLIEFDEEQGADSLRAQINAATKKGKKFRIVGLFAKPGRACSCIFAGDQRSKDRVKRGGKFGWWVCTNCRKPRLGNHELKNLIKLSEVINPSTTKGVDDMSLPVEERSYYRHPESISLVTWPERVAR